jgi:hypothetical protein
MPLAPLPYDMGNAGDLVKHGLLAEFTQWWCAHERRPLRFLDPFAGRSWTSPKQKVTRRIQALPRCAFFEAQHHPVTRYYGSSHVVLNAARAVGESAEVSVSDRDSEAQEALAADPSIRSLACPGFSPSDGFSILGAAVEADLVLLDPFAEFLPKRASDVIPRIADASERIACVLFVLNLDPGNRVGQQYRGLRSTHLSAAWCLHCPKLPDRGVHGESRFEVDVLLAWRPLRNHPARDVLRERLKRYADSLSEVLDAKITFSEGVERT